jgi:hypothetical protein
MTTPAPEARIFGAVILDQRRVMESLAGHAIVEGAVAALPDDRRAEYQSLRFLSWCRHRTATAVTAEVANRLGRMPEEFTREVVRTGVARMFRGPWAIFLRIPSNEALVKRAALVFSKTCDRGKVVATAISDTQAEVRVEGWPEAERLDLVALGAGIEAMLITAGRGPVEVRCRTDSDAWVFDVCSSARRVSGPPMRASSAPESKAHSDPPRQPPGSKRPGSSGP